MPISGYVNQTYVAQLMEMGFSKVVCEKALFMNQGAGVDKAFEWIEQH